MGKVGFRDVEVGCIFILSLNCHMALHKTLGVAAKIFLLETALRILCLNDHVMCQEILAGITNPSFFLEIVDQSL